MGACASQPKTADDCPKGLRAGQTLEGGLLRVIQPLGSGSWASVYLVERTTDGKHYALKRTLITELSEAERWIAVNEARLLASLSHPNVVGFKQCFVEDACLHVIMEVVPNGELADVVEQHRRKEAFIPENTIWGYLLQIALGLQHLHASGVIHRDVKPANVLIGRDGVLKIADLGVAGLLPKGNSKLQIGTPQYMAPEMHAGEDYTFAADVWSLGCLVHELCTLHPLFADRDEAVVAKKVTATILPPAIPGRYSPELQVLVNKMLQQDPTARPSIEAILNSAQVQGRLDLLPPELETSLSLRSISFDCMEGVPVLPPIEVPEDLSLLNQRLPGPRYSMDGEKMRSQLPERREREADRLPRVSSPTTVLEEDLCSPASSMPTPSVGGTAASSLSVIDAAVAAALAAEKRQLGTGISTPAAASAAAADDPLPQRHSKAQAALATAAAAAGIVAGGGESI